MNPFSLLLRARGAKTPVGTWVVSASPIVAEAIGQAGFDWGVLDMEHAPLDMMTLVHLLQAVGNTKMVPVVRIPSNDAVTVKRVLDAGAETLLFPGIQDAAEAARAVAATRYPPEGVRGLSAMGRASRFGTMPDYYRVANKAVGVVLQLETPHAIAQLEEIAAVPGVDALFVGPAGVSGSSAMTRARKAASLPSAASPSPGRVPAMRKPSALAAVRISGGLRSSGVTSRPWRRAQRPKTGLADQREVRGDRISPARMGDSQTSCQGDR